MKTKKCKKCGIEKGLDEFAIRTTSEDGSKVYRNECKECVKIAQKERRKMNKTKDKGIKKEPKAKNWTGDIVSNDELAGETMDRILKSTSKRIGKISKDMNLKKTNLLSALVEWGLNKMEDDKDLRQEIIELYFKLK